jgi:hypothetical protein
MCSLAVLLSNFETPRTPMEIGQYGIHGGGGSFEPAAHDA